MENKHGEVLRIFVERQLRGIENSYGSAHFAFVLAIFVSKQIYKLKLV